MSVIIFLQEVLSTINDEVCGLENLIIDNGKSSSSQGAEWAQYVEHVGKMKEFSNKSKMAIDRVVESSEKSKYAIMKLTDYGDIVKRIERLTSAIDELEYKIAMKDYDFRTIHNVLDIIDNELSETQVFHGTQFFRDLKKRVSKTKDTLKKEIFRRYREIGLWAEIPMNSSGRQIDGSSRASVILDSLRSANIVVDILGDEARIELLETLVQSQLLPYQQRSGYEGGELYALQKEKLDQRWEELYKILASASAPHMQRVMSSEWNISFLLYLTFCQQTSDNLRELLNKEVKRLYTPPPITAPLGPRPSLKNNHVSSVEFESSTHSNPSNPPPKKGFPGVNALGKVTGTLNSGLTTVAGTVVDTVGTVANGVASGVVAVGTGVTSTIGLAQSSTHSHASADYEPDFNKLSEHGNFIVTTLKNIITTEQEIHKMFDDGVFALNNNGMQYDPLTLAMISNQTKRDKNNYQYRCYLMSSIFDDYLDPFIQTERVTIQNLITSLVQDDVMVIQGNAPPPPASVKAPSTSSGNNLAAKLSFKPSARLSQTSTQSRPTQVPQDDPNDFDLISYTTSCQTIFSSSELLFQAIRTSLLKCTSFSSGKPLICLINEYKVCFQIYAELLRTTLCPSVPSDYQIIGKRKSFDQPVREEILTCRAIITSEKVIILLPQIQNEIQSKVSSNTMMLSSAMIPSAQDLDMSAQILLFEDVISYSLDLLVGSLLHNMSPCFQVFVAIPWSRVTSVGDCSPYISLLSQSLQNLLPRYRKVLTWKYFETLCYRFQCDFLDYFLALIMGLKKICVIGAEQMLLDMNEIKPLITKLHYVALPIKSIERQTMKITEKYQDIIQKKLRIIEIVLKLLCSDDDQIDENFYIMWPEGRENDLNVIKSLKMPRTTPTPTSGGNIAHHTSTDHENDSTMSSEGNPHNNNHGNIFLDNKLTHGIEDAVGKIDNAMGNAMGNLKMKASNFTDKLKIGKKDK